METFSQQPATAPYPETDKSNPQFPTLFLEGPFLYYLPIYG